MAALYLLATGRWGSYVGVPGMPVYIGDILLGLAALQTALALRFSRTRLRDIGRALAGAPLGLLLCLALLAWAGIRFVAGIADVMSTPLVALRDVAPYAYALAALLVLMVPAADGLLQRRLVYVALTVHVAWILLVPRLPGWPWAGPLLGGTPIFTTRPDIDAAVLGAAVALALHELLLGHRPRRTVPVALLVLFAAANAYAAATIPTRAGFLAGVVGVATVLCIWVVRGVRLHRYGAKVLAYRGTALLLATAALALAVAVSPPGQRLVSGVSSQPTQASGTIAVRKFVWGSVADYVTADPGRTAVGVGFGPSFIDASGTAYALEGTEYTDVRSPHNYVLGTLARLGVAGALLAVLILLTGVQLAVRTLAKTSGTLSVLASLVLLTLPVTALLGVVLESPFGAIPYFWAVGQLARPRSQSPQRRQVW